MKARFLNGREIGPYTLHYVEVYGKDLAYFEGKEQEPSKVGPYGWRESEGFWVRIRNVGRSHYEGLVHNLEVEPDNSYLVPFAVHNCMQPLDQTPYVLSDEARKKQWLPPFGISALPSKMRKAVPENLRYWNMKDLRKALEARDKLSEMEELGGTELKSDEKLHLERFRSEGIDEDLKHPKKRKQELLADLRYLGNSGWPRLEKGEPWGEWTKKDVRAYFAAIVDALRGIGLAIAPPEPDDPKHDTSYWRLYRSARPLMESEPPKEDSKGGPGSGHHGHAGRPGKVGGSALGSPSGLGRSTSPEELSRKSDARGLSVLEKNIVSESERADSLRTRLFKDKPERAFSKMKDPEVRGQVKQEVIEKISSASGVDEDTVSGILKTWAETSKATPESIRLQEAAAEEFGLPRPDLKPLMDSSGKVPEFSKEQARSVLRAMYDTTQADLKKAGFSKTDSILVFRGVKRTEGKYRLGESIRYRGNPLQSWSVLWETARSFGSTKSSKEIGLILAAEVPISAILCSARTGLGCLGEYEIVCFCDRLGNSATIISLSEKNARTWSNADE